MANFFFTPERYPYMYKNTEIGVFTVDMSSNGDYIYTLDLYAPILEEHLPWHFKDDATDTFISLRTNEEIHKAIVSNWVSERIFPPERQDVEELLEYIGLTEYDQLSIIKFTSVSHRDDHFWVKFNPTSTYESIIERRLGKNV